MLDDRMNWMINFLLRSASAMQNYNNNSYNDHNDIMIILIIVIVIVIIICREKDIGKIFGNGSGREREMKQKIKLL